MEWYHVRKFKFGYDQARSQRTEPACQKLAAKIAMLQMVVIRAVDSEVSVQFSDGSVTGFTDDSVESWN
jgi:hypothetical protein